MKCPAVFVTPAPYVVGYSFAGYQAQNPSKPLPGQRVDIELAGLAAAIGGLICALQRIQRTDGYLANGLVTYDSLSPDLIARFGLPAPLVALNIAQFKHALALSRSVGTIDQAVLADPNDAVNIEWTSGGIVTPGDALATLVQTTLGYSNAQMAALFTRAARLLILAPLGGVTIAQIKRALAATSQVASIDAGISADPNNLARIQWTSGGTSAVGDPLWLVLSGVLGAGPVQALYALAAQQPT